MFSFLRDEEGTDFIFPILYRGQNNFRNKIAKKIQSPEAGGKIQSVSRIKLSFDGNQVFFGSFVFSLKRTNRYCIKLLTQHGAVIPVKTGIQSFQEVKLNLDSRLRGNDNIIYQVFLYNSFFQLFYE